MLVKVSKDMSDERCEGEEEGNDQQCDNPCECNVMLSFGRWEKLKEYEMKDIGGMV